MIIIVLTSPNGQKIYLNAAQIIRFYEVVYTYQKKEIYTSIEVQNAIGDNCYTFYVKETPQQILCLIENHKTNP